MRVLVVDDDPLIQQALKALLRSRCAVSCAGSAEAALVELETGPLPDLILVDERLDGLSGIEFRATLSQHQQWAAIPTVLMTGGELPRNVAALGFSAGLAKPFSNEELVPILQRFAPCGTP